MQKLLTGRVYRLCLGYATYIPQGRTLGGGGRGGVLRGRQILIFKNKCVVVAEYSHKYAYKKKYCPPPRILIRVRPYTYIYILIPKQTNLMHTQHVSVHS